MAYLIDNMVTKSNLKNELAETKKEIVNELSIKITTQIDGLAQSTAKGFATTATKDELKAVEGRLSRKIKTVLEVA